MFDESLRARVERQSARIVAAARQRESLFAQTLFLGTVGLMFILPVVAGAYAGLWLDARVSKPGAFSVEWTLTGITSGVALGAMNVYLLIRRGSR